MASGNADLYTAQRLAAGFPPSLVDASIGTNGDFNSRIDDSKRTEAAIEYADAVYTVLGTEANTEVINLFYLPIGAQVYPEHSFVFREVSPGTTFTVNVGDSTIPARYASNMAMGGAAGILQFTASVANVSGVTAPIEVTAATRLVSATISAAISAAAAGAKIHFKIGYKVLQP